MLGPNGNPGPSAGLWGTLYPTNSKAPCDAQGLTYTGFGDADETLLDVDRQHYRFNENTTLNGNCFARHHVPDAYPDDTISIYQCSYRRIFADIYNAKHWIQTRGNNQAYIDVDLSTCTIAGTNDPGGVMQDYGVIDEGGGWCAIWMAVDVESGTPSFLDAYARISKDDTHPYANTWNFVDGRIIAEIRDPFFYAGSAPC